MGLMLFDSAFFVDLDREHRSGRRGAATRFLEAKSTEEMAMSVITRGELARGFSDQARWLRFCEGFLVFPLDDGVLWRAAETFGRLREGGAMVSDNDLWIGATALRHGLPLVTDNVRHFSRMPGLVLRDYRKE